MLIIIRGFSEITTKKAIKKLYPTQVSIPSEKQLNLVTSLSTKRHKIVSGRLFPEFFQYQFRWRQNHPTHTLQLKN